MADEVRQLGGVTVLLCDPAGPPIATEADALDLIGAAFLGATVVAVPAERLDRSFFALGTRFAGEVMQKFVNYRLRLVVVGDISAHLAASGALRALVAESNRHDQVWFVPDLSTLDARLAATP
ncbi:DUF4180 domain-containing protein [Micromonospora sp. WMMD980]|uniref:DUF4180 domain-containing protein n=1 Tax=Micromonospora sp. WMMD980 TaxID=3016088 RepID=UPI0024171715|nr:DUF4180 domain-containing protein [Micromonospora sp. WMMD980]MDG4800879.1 DUF4180 domain-containing protein [Micromonospora sp. WMMD980]